MTPLPADVTDSQIIEFLDRWASLLEREDYEAAQAFVGHYHTYAPMTADDIRQAIKRHGERVTLEGVADGARHPVKEVTRWPTKPDDTCGDIWYDLYIDGQSSDLTALFYLMPAEGGLMLELVDISVR